MIFITITASFLQFATIIKLDNVYLNNRRVFAKNYLSPIAKNILKYASPGESMAVWGWASELYFDTGLIQATRAGVLGSLNYSPLQQYFF